MEIKGIMKTAEKIRKWGMVWVLLGWLAAGCYGEGPRIVTTVGMLTDIARVVTGDTDRVKGLIGEGVDPHLYKPTRGDVVALQAADIVIYNGLRLEGKMTDILEGLGQRGKPVLAVSEAVLASGRYAGEPGDYGADPHLWMDVAAWRLAVGEVGKFLAEVDPERGERYHANAKAYMQRLEELDAYAKRVLATVPESRRVLVTAHDAFGYFGRAYGLEVRGIQGISTESEAGIKDLEVLLRDVVDRDIPAIFVESSVSDKNVRALVEGARAKGHSLSIGGTLFSDAMGQPGTYRGTYFGMLDHNITTIAAALGGNVPEGGIHGKLTE